MLGLTRKYFGTRVALKFLLNIRAAVSGDALVSAFEKVGEARMDFQGVKLNWQVANPLFIYEIIERQCYTGPPGFQIEPNWTIVDAGANIGTFTLYAASKAPEGHVIALEANPRLHAILCRNIEANSLNNVTAVNAAVSSVEGGRITFELIPSGGSIKKGYAAKPEQVEVTSLSLSEIPRKYGLTKIDLLKMDIEGAEFDCFNEPSWLSFTQRIAMEVHPAYGDINWISKILSVHGFDVHIGNAYLGDNLKYMWAERRR